MKKVLILFLVLTMVGLIGCGKSKELSADEKLVMEYIDTCLNSKDTEKKKIFVEQKTDPEVQFLFEMTCSGQDEAGKIDNPKITDSTDIKLDEESDGQAFLVKSSDADYEFVVILRNSKLFWVYGQKDEGYQQLLEQF